MSVKAVAIRIPVWVKETVETALALAAETAAPCYWSLAAVVQDLKNV